MSGEVDEQADRFAGRVVEANDLNERIGAIRFFFGLAITVERRFDRGRTDSSGLKPFLGIKNGRDDQTRQFLGVTDGAVVFPFAEVGRSLNSITGP